MGRPAELADWLDPIELVAAFDEDFGIPGEGSGVAADVGYAWHGRGRKLADLFLRSRPGWIEDDCIEGRKFFHVIGPAIKVAMLGSQQPP